MPSVNQHQDIKYKKNYLLHVVVHRLISFLSNPFCVLKGKFHCMCMHNNHVCVLAFFSAVCKLCVYVCVCVCVCVAH